MSGGVELESSATQNHYESQPNGNGGLNYFSEEEDFESGNDAAKLYERSRIKALAGERETVQKRTFTHWINSHLIQYNIKVEDIFMELRDGKYLIYLLERLSGERLEKPTRGKMRIHCLENIEKVLRFLNMQHVKLENIGGFDIVDGNARLTLGLIWTIILRYQISTVTIDMPDAGGVAGQVRSAKDTLLLWAQMKTAEYPNVNIRDMSRSWRDGYALNALIHRQRPDLIDMTKLSKQTPLENVRQAFEVAAKLGIPKMMEPEDVCAEIPDEKSIMTTVSTFYHYINKDKSDQVNAKRLGKVLDQANNIEALISQYETRTGDLLEWIRRTIEILNDRQFANSLSGVQQQLAAFNTYRTVEKPPKFKEKGDLEIDLFSIHSLMRTANRMPFVPSDGRTIYVINRAWEELEKAEHEREMNLREELIRQEKLNQLAARFDRKAKLREGWLIENQRLVNQDNFGDDLGAVVASTKKHEAIVTDIFAYEERINAVINVAEQLEKESYNDIERVNERKNAVLYLWNELMSLLQIRRARLDLSLQLHNVFHEMIYLFDWIEEISSRLKSEDYGKHLLGVEDLVQKHSLLEADIRVLGNRMNDVLSQSQYFIQCNFEENVGADYRPIDPNVVVQRGNLLQESYDNLVKLSDTRKHNLEESRRMWQFFWEIEDDKEWIKEKAQLMSNPDLGHDLSSVERLLRKHRALEEDIQNRKKMIDQSLDKGHQLIKEKNFGADQIKDLITEINQLWQQLIELTTERKNRLNESLEFYQLLADCDDANTWIDDQMRIIQREDLGDKMSVTLSLIKKHEDDIENIKKYKDSIDDLRRQAREIAKYPETDSQKTDQKLDDLDKYYGDLLNACEIRKKKLNDGLSMYKVFNVADSVKSWITEKEKLLTTLVPGDEIEELEIIRHRFDCFESEMANNVNKVDNVNKMTQDLQQSEHVDPVNITAQQQELNEIWNVFEKKKGETKKQLDSAYRYNQFLVEAQETQNWILEKEKLLESTDELGNDLEGIMQLQRRLGGLQNDLGAIKARVEQMNDQADLIVEEKPETEPIIMAEKQKNIEYWNDLQKMVKDRDEKLNNSSELQRFLQDLDHFQLWLRDTSTEVASEDVPNSLQEADKLLTQHKQTAAEITTYEPEFHRLMEFGRKITDNQTDTQYVFLNQRINGIEEGWDSLQKMRQDRDNVLRQSLDAQVFFRDAHQAEILQVKQDTNFSKEDIPNTHQAVEEELRNHENNENNMLSNAPKIDSVLASGKELIDQGNIHSEKIENKCKQIIEKRDSIISKGNTRKEKLQETLILQEYYDDIDDVNELLGEKMILISDESFIDSKNVTATYGKWKAFEEELSANEEKVENVIKAGEDMIQKYPHMQDQIEPKLEDVRQNWNELKRTVSTKSDTIAEANREKLFDEGAKSMMSWVTEISSQIVIQEEEVVEEIGLTEIQNKMKEHDDKENQLGQKKKMLDDIEVHAQKLKEKYPERQEEFEQIQQEVRIKLVEVEAPIANRRKKLDGQKKFRQFLRDIEDELEWVAEKKNLVLNNGKLGDSLLSVQQLIRRLKMLGNEIENHRPRIESVTKVGEEMIADYHPKRDLFREEIDKLWTNWDELNQILLNQQAALDDNLLTQQYVFDASEAEAWMGEQELYLMGEEKSKDDQSAANSMKKHEQIENMIENYADEIRSLGERSRKMMLDVHKDADHVTQKQARVDKMYAGLKDLCVERRLRLEEIVKLYQLLRQIKDLETWILERTVVASSHDIGADYEYCCLLRDRFTEFARDTNEIGSVRVNEANELCDNLIDMGHSESAEIAQWKDRLNETWADLLELIETRIQFLKTAWDLHKFMCDCQDLLDRISEKTLVIPDEAGRDAKSVAVYQRKHQAFEQEIVRLGGQIDLIVAEAYRLLPLYSGEKERQINEKRDEVLHAWRQLGLASEQRKVRLLDGADLHRFLAMARELEMWMEDIQAQINADEKSRDVAGAELLINNHRSLKAEIDSREENFSICLSLGRTLLNRRHPSEDLVREKCKKLVAAHIELEYLWNDRWEHLKDMREARLFQREAANAEAWLIAQEPHMQNRELGENLEQTLALLKKHLEFIKTFSLQEERFEYIRKLTNFEMKERERSHETELSRQNERKRRIESACLEFEPLPPPPQQQSSMKKHSPQQRSSKAGGDESAPQQGAEFAQQQQQMQQQQQQMGGAGQAGQQREAAGTSSSSGGAAGAQRSATPPPSSSSQQPHPLQITMEGVLQRKHEWETSSKKASGRTWHELFIRLVNCQLHCYKDQKSFAQLGDTAELYHHEQPISITGAKAFYDESYVKRGHVFRLKLESGGEYLFQARSDHEMQDWIKMVNLAAGESSAASMATRGSSGSGVARQATTLPAGSSLAGGSGGEQSAQPAAPQQKKKFFTMGKKK